MSLSTNLIAFVRSPFASRSLYLFLILLAASIGSLLTSCSSSREGEVRIARKWRHDYRLLPATLAKAPAARTSGSTVSIPPAPESSVLEEARLTYAGPRPALDDTRTREEALIARAQALLADRQEVVALGPPAISPALTKRIQKAAAQHAEGKRIPGGATAGFIVGLLGFLIALGAPGLGLILGILGIVFGAVALGKQNSDPEEFGGKGLSIAALVLGILAVLIGIGGLAGS